MEKYSEDLLRYLGINETERINWYKARHYVQKFLMPMYGTAISPNSSERLHVVFEDVSPLMMAVVRQICLIAHYPNFDEETGRNRTSITICTKNPDTAYNDIRSCDYLGNLLEYCKCTVNGKSVDNSSFILPLDIKFEFVNNASYSTENTIVIKSEDVEKGIEGYEQKFDVTMGMLVNMVYNTGAEIDNLSASDNDNIERYTIALNVFCYKLKQDLIMKKWNGCVKLNKDGTYNETDIKNKLSSVFCADCFEPRIKGLFGTNNKPVAEYILQDFNTVMKKISNVNTITALAKCEHARWNVEKLIMGFKPLCMTDWYDLESCFGTERKNKIKTLKKQGRHIDLCSYRNLQRINPADMKYDYFLMLAMPQIMRSYLLAK